MKIAGIISLRDAGADFAVIASNTPHIVFDEVDKLSPLPLLSIVEATAQKAATLKLKKLLLIGTIFTMESTFYQNSNSNYNISVVVPSAEEQEIIYNIIFPELEEGIVIPKKKNQLINICNKIIEKENIDGRILGCTELPLMIKDDDFRIEVLNTTKIHVEGILKYIFEN
ncbi:MAG: amino acid racemase [Spirochaetia bacterium]|nr:amino acid racemase [Spirochaetia bacterium]